LSARAKFLFDRDFGAGGADAAKRMVALAAHEAALADARAKAYRDGFAAAQAELAADERRRAAAALERIAAGIADLAQRFAAVEGRFEAEAVEVAVAVARKLASELISREPFADIAALARHCFTHLVGAPHVVVRVNDALHGLAREALAEIARTHGFEGRLVVLAEPEIALGDCRIEWADGGVVRDRAMTEAAINEAVGRYAAARRAAFER
jgi:flagellar assembly protein FliH